MAVQDEEHGCATAATRAERTATQDGSVNWSGRPCLRDRSGGWLAGFLMLANQALVTFAVKCVGTNLVTFMAVVMRLDNADAANRANNWAGTTYVFSIVGALVSDSYWGRYKACTIFQIIFLAGLVELSIASHLLLERSCDFGQHREAGRQAQHYCRPPTRAESLVLYISIYQIALGNGAYQPAATTFGADQFDETDAGERKSKSAFFGYFFVANNLGGVLAVTALAYMEDKGEWVLAFWISTAAALVGVVLFALGTLRYRHFLPNGNAIVSVCQVIVAATKKRHVKTPQQAQDLYEEDDAAGDAACDGNDDGEAAKNNTKMLRHTPDFRCLDKAAVVVTTAPTSRQPWSLCTVTQVEELKCILRLAPIWVCSILYSTAYSQMSSVFIEQAQAMDASLWGLNIPAAGMGVFEILGVTAFVFIYRFCIARIMSKVVSREPTELERMGVGLVISTLAMITSGVVEQQRLKHHATQLQASSSSLTILWQIPQYVLIGASEVFMYVTMTEFFNDQLPEGLRSLGSAMSVASMSAGNYASSLLVTVVMAITCKGGQQVVAGCWIPQDLNQGHVDRFFFVIAALNAMDLLAYVVFAKRYRPAPLIKTAGADETS
ncbi:hypothetical protein PVAP13_9KG248301 [Panicum virgatum]|uniref:Uncharacterized protein n=1 Tax=Panicum virgatum TaxID=38727 RepID=A0A8T0P402_PANVG|nr:hypothetical protein PVAP13_9KG248301 [Panicum virgatum]